MHSTFNTYHIQQHSMTFLHSTQGTKQWWRHEQLLISVMFPMKLVTHVGLVISLYELVIVVLTNNCIKSFHWQGLFLLIAIREWVAGHVVTWQGALEKVVCHLASVCLFRGSLCSTEQCMACLNVGTLNFHNHWRWLDLSSSFKWWVHTTTRDDCSILLQTPQLEVFLWLVFWAICIRHFCWEKRKHALKYALLKQALNTEKKCGFVNACPPVFRVNNCICSFHDCALTVAHVLLKCNHYNVVR